MPLLLVDDRDGRIVAEVEADEALELMEAWARDDGSIPAHYSLVQFDSREGSILGVNRSVTIRPLG